MHLLYVGLKSDRKGGVGAAALVLAIIAAGAIGFFVVFSDDSVTVEARIHDADWSKDPMSAKLDVRVTNKLAFDLVVQRLQVTVWADQARTVALSSASVTAVRIAGHTAELLTLPLEIRNADAFGGKVWVDVDAAWQWSDGSAVRHESVTGKELSVGEALAKFS